MNPWITIHLYGARAGTIPHLRTDKAHHDGDLAPDTHIQAIANTAGFHFGFIEQGGSSLYPTLAQGVTNLKVLRILLPIGPKENLLAFSDSMKMGQAQLVRVIFAWIVVEKEHSVFEYHPECSVSLKAMRRP